MPFDFDTALRRGLLATALTLTACAGAPATRTPPVDATLAAWAEAVRNGDAAAAYALLDESARAAMPFEIFEAQFEEYSAEARDQADAVERAGEAGVETEARVVYAEGDEVRLPVEGHHFAVDGAVLGQGALRTPADAVRALGQAARRRDLDALLSVLSRDSRAALLTELEAVDEGTRDGLAIDADVRGDRATVTLPSGLRVILVREAGQWRVVEVQ